MKVDFLRNCIFSLTLILLSFSTANAHKVRVFAYESGGEIIAEGKFNSGRPAQKSDILVIDNSTQTTILTGATDKQGIFRFAIPPEAITQHMDLNIIVDVGEGHRGSWLLQASDYLGDTVVVTQEPEAKPLSPTQHRKEEQAHQFTENVDYSRLEKLIEKTIEREIAPIKRILTENMEHKMSLQDILGGLGYIFGLAGIAAYVQSKKKGAGK